MSEITGKAFLDQAKENEKTEAVVQDVGPRSYSGAMINSVPALVCYDAVKDESTVIDVNHPFYAQALAAFSIIEVAFAPVL